MNNRESLKIHQDTPEREKLKKDILDQLTDISNNNTVESPWIIDVKTNSERLSIVVNRKDSTAKHALLQLHIDLQPVFPLSLKKDKDFFFEQRMAKLEDAVALIEDLTVINVLKEKE